MRRMDRQTIPPKPCYRYYMLHKPVGCVSACRDGENQTVLDFFRPEERPGLFPVGRLDKNTQGLLLVTDDGKLTRRLLEPENHVEKQYLLWAAGELTPEKIAQLESGLVIKGIRNPTRPARLEVLETKTLGALPVSPFPKRRELAESQPDSPAFCAMLTITEGKRHQVKRMLQAVECTVVYLKRVAFGGILLDESLRPGEYRPLTWEEKRLLGIQE